MKNQINKPVLGLIATAAIVSPFLFTDRDKSNLIDVDQPLVEVSYCAFQETKGGFQIIDGKRTDEEHAKNLANGKSWIKRSRHQDGKAIDFWAKFNGKITKDEKYFPPIILAFKKCSQILNIPIVAGGDWKQRDWGHIELDRRKYP